MNIRSVFRTVGSALSVGALGACAMNSNPAEITVYHGQGNSQAVSYELGTQGRRSSSQRQLELSVPEGTRVCMNVLNAHTPGFNYALRVSVDSTPPTPPNFGGLLELLTSVIPGSGTAAGTALNALRNESQKAQELDALNQSDPDSVFIATYTARLDSLEKDLQTAKEAIRLSLFPETLVTGLTQAPSNERRGLRYAQEQINALPSSEGRFNDPKLEETITAWKQNAPQSATMTRVVDALHKSAMVLVAARNAVRDTYSKAAASWRECRAITNGVTTMKLAVTPRSMDEFTGQRDTGSLVQVTATSDYRRNVVEIVPLAFLAFPRNVTGFGVRNDTVVEGVKYAESASFRVGTMVTATPLRFGSSNEWAFGPGFGTGLIGGEKPALSDFFLGGLISWRDWLRMGVGYGVSQAPAGLINGAAVGKPLPLGEGREKLSDFIENRRVGTWFLTFTINGLKIKLPGS
ncbi:MAG TPA: hypothetical protein VM715_09225 [Candidatus Acidoferrum sp.]|nr:hypothetical protein [Candidatus Acidoferrum sp.]